MFSQGNPRSSVACRFQHFFKLGTDFILRFSPFPTLPQQATNEFHGKIFKGRRRNG